ncbi:MAG: cellulase family glycosylhydrolase [Bacteroidetes bacterium]|nr:cellulase family glycosylhydrolase [Bacteroidota bacterium]
MAKFVLVFQRWLICFLAGGLLAASVVMAQGTATYELTFTPTWSASTHPNGFPPNPHFSGLIGATHSDAVHFWRTGEVATDGIKQMAELGAKGAFRSEINQAINASNADAIVDASGVNSPGVRKTTFEVRPPWNFVTVTSMLAPSPDWFVGVSGLDLLDGDMNWIDTLEVELFVYDAGTDSGSDYTSPNQPTSPREEIRRIQEAPFLVSGVVKPVGTFRFELKEVELPSAGYFSVGGTEILDANGQPTVIKGMGLGGWLLPEGYMLHISTRSQPTDGPTGIRNQMIDLIGERGTDEFFELFREKYVQEKDIAKIKEWGFDHIRLPFHYRLFYNPELDTWEEDGFELLDMLLEWCRRHEVNVILDMHAAPGAQNEGGISDSDGEARLWTEPDKYWPQTIKIWREIARRYSDEPLIIGYDLINEPTVPDEIARSLANLYTRIIDAVQPISPNHLFFLEGNWWATSFDEHLRSIPQQRGNVVYSFHHYWKGADQGAIQYLLSMRDEDQVPLYLGETGENSNSWFYALTKVAEEHRIGINWWTHKKIETTTSPLSAPFAPGYAEVTRYWRGDGPEPSGEVAYRGLIGMAHYLDLDSARVNRGLLAALFDPEFGTVQKPFKEHEVPGIINAADYDLGNQGVAYQDSDHWAVTGNAGGGNSGREYRNDGVDIEPSTDPNGFAYNVGFTERFEWLEFTLDVLHDGVYEIDVRGASQSGGDRTGSDILFSLDGDRIGEVEIGNTGGWQQWVTEQARTPELKAGTQRILRVSFADREVNLNRMTFRLVSTTQREEADEIPAEPELLATYPNPFTEVVHISFSTPEPVTATAVLYDMLGRQVYQADDATYSAGSHEISLTLDLALAPGVYVLRLKLDGPGLSKTITRPLVATK